MPAALLGPLAALLLALLITIIGFYAVREVLRDTPNQDPGWIVVDEAAGMLIALACTLSFLPAMLTLLRPRGEAAEIGSRSSWA